MKPDVSIVLPCYNEEAVLSIFFEALMKIVDTLSYTYEVILIDDGSTDGTLALLKTFAKQRENTYYIELSRNFGHQYALLAGLTYARGSAVISMDTDMQHPVSLLPTLLDEWQKGYEIVYTLREDTLRTSWLKKQTSIWFYAFLRKITGVPIENGTSDFRLLDTKVVKVVRDMRESDMFLRGLIYFLGFKQKKIPFVANQRYAGSSKYSIKKMIELAVHGVLSMTTRPLYISTYIGLVLAILSLLYIPYVLYSYWKGGVVSGWISLIMTVSFLGGIQLFILGLIGIYLGKMYTQTKARPTFIVRETNISPQTPKT